MSVENYTRIPIESSTSGKRRINRRQAIGIGGGIAAAAGLTIFGALADRPERRSGHTELEEALREDYVIRRQLSELMGVDSLPNMKTTINEDLFDGELIINHGYTWGSFEDYLISEKPYLHIIIAWNDAHTEEALLANLRNPHSLVWRGPQKEDSINAHIYYGAGEGETSAGVHIYTRPGTKDEVAQLAEVGGAHLRTIPAEVTLSRLQSLAQSLIDRTTIGLGSPFPGSTTGITPSSTID